jgi:DNA-binding beta-propeller fold protein YncE
LIQYRLYSNLKTLIKPLISLFFLIALLFFLRPFALQAQENTTPPESGFKDESSFITGSTFGSRGNEKGFFRYPVGIAFDSEGNLFIADWGNKRVQCFDANFKNILTIDANLDGPCGIAIDSRNYLYVSEIRNNRISKFDLKGNLIDTMGSYGKGEGKFREPRGIAVDKADNLYVSDSKNRRIQKFDKTGKFITKFVYRYKRADYEKPRWTACDERSNVYAVYPDVNRIVKFDQEGNLLFDMGSKGDIPGLFNEPRCISIDGDSNFYVSDYNNNRIQKFSSAGDILEIIGLPAQAGTESAPGCLNRPEGTCFDKFGRLFVCDAEHDRIQIFDLKPQLLYRNEARINLNSGNRKEAVNSYLKLKALLPKDTESSEFLKKTYLMDAKDLEFDKKYDDAAEIYRKMVQLGLYSKDDLAEELKKLKFLKYKWIIYSLSASLVIFFIFAVIIINTGKKNKEN